MLSSSFLNYSSSKASLPSPQTGHSKSSGMSSHLVVGGDAVVGIADRRVVFISTGANVFDIRMPYQ